MLILLNGQDEDIQNTDLEAALNELGYGEAIVATAVNGDFVPVEMRGQTSLKEGDMLEVLAPMQGG